MKTVVEEMRRHIIRRRTIGVYALIIMMTAVLTTDKFKVTFEIND